MDDLNWGNDAPALAENYGLHLYGVRGYLTPEVRSGVVGDAVPNYTPGTLVTDPNDGFLVQFFNYIDPTEIPVLVAPNRAAEIFGEGKIGSWEQMFATFMMSEDVGQVAAYGDRNRGGTADTNLNYEQRQQFLVQAFIEAGDLELARAGAGRYDLMGRKRRSQANTLNKWQNRSYFFGVSGLRNYGVLTDPGLSPANAPTTGATTGKITWADKQCLEIYEDFVASYGRLQTNAQGLLDTDMDETTKIRWGIAPTDRTYLKKTNEFGLSVEDLVKKSFPGSEIVTAPQFATASGNILYGYVPELDGIDTIQCAFSEKLRTHRVEYETSLIRQKVTSGSWGAIAKRPLLIDQTIGI